MTLSRRLGIALLGAGSLVLNVNGARAHPLFHENVTIYDGIGVAVAHLVHVFYGFSADELPPNNVPGKPGILIKGIKKVTFVADDVVKTDPFGFTGPLVLPAGFPSDAWTESVIDPIGEVEFVISANTAKYGDTYLITNPLQDFDYSFFFTATELLPGYPYQVTFEGADGNDYTEDGFHPRVTPEPTTLAIFASGLAGFGFARLRRTKRSAEA